MELRIAAGIYKNRRLKSIPGKNLRPLSGRMKESLFAILSKKIEGCFFLDLFAGTGNVGLEALSRGAKMAVFVEKDKLLVEIIKNNICKLGVEDKTHVILSDVFDFTFKENDIIKQNPSNAITKQNPSNAEFDIVFAGPPYRENLGTKILKYCKTSGANSNGTIMVLQRHNKEKIIYNGYERVDQRNYGITVMDFFKCIGKKTTESTEKKRQ